MPVVLGATLGDLCPHGTASVTTPDGLAVRLAILTMEGTTATGTTLLLAKGATRLRVDDTATTIGLTVLGVLAHGSLSAVVAVEMADVEEDFVDLITVRLLWQVALLGVKDVEVEP
jgi:hypothetical protein